MLAILYILLSFSTGYVLCTLLLPELSTATDTTLRKAPLRLSKLFVLVPAWYITGTLLMTWITYFSAYAFKSQAKPLIFGNMISMLFATAVSAVGILMLVRKKAGFHMFGKTSRISAGEITLIILVIALVYTIMYRTFFVKDNALYVGVSVFSDFSPHIGMIRSFSFGNNFPTTYSHFAGEDIRYHFMFQFLVGNLEFLGLRLDHAFNIPSFLCLVFAFFLLYALALRISGKRIVGYISCLMFAFRCSPSLLKYMGTLEKGTVRKTLSENTAFIGYTTHEDWGLWNLNVYANQRHLALGICVMLLLIHLFIPNLYRMAERWKEFAEERKRREEERKLAAEATRIAALEFETVDDEEDFDTEEEEAEALTSATVAEDTEEIGASAIVAAEKTEELEASVTVAAEKTEELGASETVTKTEAAETNEAAEIIEAAETTEASTEKDEEDVKVVELPVKDNPLDKLFGLMGDFLYFSFFRKEGWLPKRILTPIVAGFLLGAAAFWNGAAVLATIMILFFFAMAADNRLEYLITAVLATGLSLCQTKFFTTGESVVKTKLQYGFIAENTSFFGAVDYVLRLCGILIIVLFVAFITVKGVRKWILVAFSVPFVFSFYFSLTIDVTVNHKYIMLSIMLMNIFAAILLTKLYENKNVWYKVLATVLLVLLTMTGIYDYQVVMRKNSPNGGCLVFQMEDPMIDWIKENTNSQDIFLSSHYALSRPVLAGAMLYEGHAYYPYTAGYDTNARYNLSKKMFECDDFELLKRMLRDNKITYVIIDNDARTTGDFRLNERIFSDNFEAVYEEGDGMWKITIYDVSKVISN